MPTVSELFPARYSKADDFRSGPRAVTIDHVAVEPVGPDKTAKAVVYFRENVKPVVCNKTNATRLGLKLGPNTEDWAGAKISLHREMVQFGSNFVAAIRVQVPASRQAMPPPPPDDVPFDDVPPATGPDDYFGSKA
jgi:hypothetical protein